MKDIDFDELDKAVNSLMSKNTKPETAKEPEPTSDKTVQDQNEALSTTAEVATPEPQAEEPVQSEEATPAAAPKPPAPARKRSGRFMDMVHPSADMKNKPSTGPISREGATIAAPAASPTPESVPAPAEATTPEPTTAETISESAFDSMLGPIAMHEEQNTSAAEAEIEQAQTEPEVSEPEQPVQSGETPFLADAKVEKRPLGADGSGEKFADKPMIAPTDETATEETISKPEELDKPPLEPTPAELNADVVAIEASDPQADEKPNTEPVSDENEPKPEPAEPEVPAGGAINQQYKEQPSSGDTRHAAIYDAETYPATGVVHSKKHSGWMWVLWIFILLSLGAGGAVALYLMKII